MPLIQVTGKQGCMREAIGLPANFFRTHAQQPGSATSPNASDAKAALTFFSLLPCLRRDFAMNLNQLAELYIRMRRGAFARRTPLSLASAEFPRAFALAKQVHPPPPRKLQARRQRRTPVKHGRDCALDTQTPCSGEHAREVRRLMFHIRSPEKRSVSLL